MSMNVPVMDRSVMKTLAATTLRDHMLVSVMLDLREMGKHAKVCH